MCYHLIYVSGNIILKFKFINCKLKIKKIDTSGIRTHARRLVPKTSALDRSAIVSYNFNRNKNTQTGENLRTFIF
jgi:hypothetical protein